jgi:hypothetical protein
MMQWCSLANLSNLEVGGQKHADKVSFSTSDAVLTSLNLVQLCCSLVSSMDAAHAINARACNYLTSESLNAC